MRLRRLTPLGDLELGLTKLLLGERDAVPELLLGARWKAATGSARGPLPLGTGADSLQGLVTALRRHDPLALFGTLYYSWNTRSGAYDLGDAAGVILGTALAATPDASLQLALDVASLFSSRFDGRTIEGSDRVSAMLDLGFSMIVGRRTLLNLTAEIGLTPAAPDLRVILSLPLRF